MELRIVIQNEKLWKIFSVIIMISIFINSSRPVQIDNSVLLIPHLDKVLHILAWTILSLSLSFAFQTYINEHKDQIKIRSLFILLTAIGYGIFDEFHQYFVPTRVMDILDVVADSIGSIIGIFISYYLLKLVSNSKVAS